MALGFKSHLRVKLDLDLNPPLFHSSYVTMDTCLNVSGLQFLTYVPIIYLYLLSIICLLSLSIHYLSLIYLCTIYLSPIYAPIYELLKELDDSIVGEW